MPARTLLSALAIVSTVFTTAQAANPRPEVVYGEDNRLDLHDTKVPESWRLLARSTAVLMETSKLTPHASRAGHLNVASENFGDAMQLCADEPFREQPTAGFCSGFLVGPDILVTAGHCMTSQTRCDSTSFVFDFGYNEPTTDLSSVPSDNVFTCKSIIAQEVDDETQSDFAIVRLDRPVAGRTPLQYKKQGATKSDTKLLVIGHPSGLPTKVAGDASVRNSNPDKPFFVANLDTYGGNSGSAVFNEETREIEGILVRGERDFQYVNGCSKSNVCAQDACRGEDVTKSTVFAEYLDIDERPTEIHAAKITGLATPIPDNDPAGITQDLNILSSGEIAAIGVRVKIEHTYPGDLRVSMRHPNGTEVYLGALGNSSHFSKPDDSPTDNPASRPATVIERTFGMDGVAVKALWQLRKLPANGNWQVIIRDAATSDLGTLQEVELKVQTFIQ